MHDLVGHGLTVTLLHLGSARLALEDDPAAVGASLAEAERAARGSLEDVRDAVATLRAEDGDTPAAAADMPSLVATYRLAGAPVDLRVRGGELADLPPARRVALYRVVQESLTNAVRHGDGGPVRVEIAAALVLGEGTVTTHVGHIFTKLHLRDRAAAVIFAFDHGMVRPGDPRPHA